MDLPYPDGPNKDMWLALLAHDNIKLEAALLDGANPNYLDFQGLAPVMLAVFCDNAQAVRLLASHGANFPQPASGRTFDTYFKVEPEWYNKWDKYNACAVAAGRNDLDTLRVLLSMPGAGAVLIEDRFSLHYEIEGAVQPQFDRRPARLMLDAIFEEQWRDVALTGEERDLARQIVMGYITDLVVENNCPSMSIVRTTEHINDRGFNSDEGAPRIEALSFTMGFVESPVVDRYSHEDWHQLRIDAKNCDYDFRYGTVQVSPNIVARLARCHEHQVDPTNDENESDLYYLTGTIFFSESPERLLEYIASLGPEEAAGALLKVMNPALIGRDGGMIEETGEVFTVDNWDRDFCYYGVLDAVQSGADTSLSHFGPLAADVRAAANGESNALTALIEADPVTQYRLAKKHFDVASPLGASIAHMSGVKTGRLPAVYIEPIDGGLAKWGYSNLIHSGARLDATVGHGPSLLCLAAHCKKDGPLKAFLDAGVDPNAVSANGDLPVVTCADLGKTDHLDLLLSAGADVNASTKQGVTALEAACLRLSEPLVQKLMDCGANPGLVARRLDGGGLVLSEKFTTLIHAANARSALFSAMRRVKANVASTSP